MKKLFTYFILLAAVFFGCEEIYSPEIEKIDDAIVIDARIVNGANDNYVLLNKSLGFNEKDAGYPKVSGAQVSLFDSNNTEYELPEESAGAFRVNILLDSELEYKLVVKHGSDIYESDFEPVLEVPEMDSIYGIPEIKVIVQGGENSVSDFREKKGVQLYTNLVNNNDLQHYRFTAKKIYQFTYLVEVMMFGELVEEIMYAWNTTSPTGTFNIAAPPEYSTSINISKHPLFFMEKSAGIVYGQFFEGWILYLNQYSLSKSSYDFYKDLNNQLNSEGRLFDPLYVQARNNLKCINNPDQVVLGNFEITSVKERRYYVHFLSEEKGYLIKPIPYFYDIPFSGEQITDPPDFWESPTKRYPND